MKAFWMNYLAMMLVVISTVLYRHFYAVHPVLLTILVSAMDSTAFNLVRLAQRECPVT